MQESKDSAVRGREHLQAERDAHAETRSKLEAARQNLERRTALLAETKAKLDELQSSHRASESTIQALERAEQQLKDAQAAVARKESRIKQVRIARRASCAACEVSMISCFSSACARPVSLLV